MVMIAGPNGSGKTTLWRKWLRESFDYPESIEYINADDIERELNPLAQAIPPAPQTSITAGYAQTEATQRRETLLTAPAYAQQHFVYETVFSDTEGYKLAELRRGVAAGYFVVMVFVGVDDVDLAKQRVAARFLAGEHNVDPAIQEARFPRVFANARAALNIVNLAIFFDNSGRPNADGLGHRVVAVYKNGACLGLQAQMPGWWPYIDDGAN